MYFEDDPDMEFVEYQCTLFFVESDGAPTRFFNFLAPGSKITIPKWMSRWPNMKTMKITTIGLWAHNFEPLENSDFQLFGSRIRNNHTKMDV